MVSSIGERKVWLVPLGLAIFTVFAPLYGVVVTFVTAVVFAFQRRPVAVTRTLFGIAAVMGLVVVLGWTMSVEVDGRDEPAVSTP